MQHVDLLSTLEQHAGPHGWSALQLKQSVESGSQLKLYMLNESVAGYALLMPLVDEIELLNFVIFKSWQQQGHGKAFMRELLLSLKEASYKTMLLEVRRSNLSAIALYEINGFVHTGLRRNYYRTGKNYEDALLMQRKLI